MDQSCQERRGQPVQPTQEGAPHAGDPGARATRCRALQPPCADPRRAAAPAPARGPLRSGGPRSTPPRDAGGRLSRRPARPKLHSRRGLPRGPARLPRARPAPAPRGSCCPRSALSQPRLAARSAPASSTASAARAGPRRAFSFHSAEGAGIDGVVCSRDSCPPAPALPVPPRDGGKVRDAIG